MQDTELNEQTFDMLSEEKYIKAREPIIEQYYKKWLDVKGALPLRSPLQVAITAQLMDNVRKELFPRSRNLSEAEEQAIRQLEAMGYSGSLSEATTPTTTAAWSGATTFPVSLGMIRKVMPKVFGLELITVQPLDRPAGRIFFLKRNRHNNGTDVGLVENRAGWSYRSWIDTPGEGASITKSMKFSITSADVSTRVHKLQGETSLEVEQDLRAYFGMDAMALISEAASDEIALEQNEEILHWLWDAAGNSGGGIVYIGAKPSSYTFEEWSQKHVEALVRQSMLIYNRYMVQPNWLVLGSEIGVRIGQLAAFEKSTGRTPGNFGLRRVGTLRSEWDTYEMPLNFPVNDALMGYKGQGLADAGALWHPYTPWIVAGTEFDTNTQVRKISWQKRDGYYMVNPGYYGIVRVDETSYTGLSYPAFTAYTPT